MSARAWWLWFVGMIVTTSRGTMSAYSACRAAWRFMIMPIPRSRQAFSVSMSVTGGLILLISGVLFLAALIRGHRAPGTDVGPYRFAVVVHVPARIPIPLNSFGLWLALMIGLTVVNYGYPIAQLMVLPETNVPAVYVGAGR